MVLGKQGRGLLRLKVPHRPRRGVPEGNTFPCPHHHTLASAACPPVPAMRALNSVGRFFLPLVPIETFLASTHLGQERLTLLLALGCVEGQGGERRFLLRHKVLVRWGLPREPSVSKRRC